MPIYEYLCRKCNKKFETLVHGHEDVQCPSCNGSDIAKQFSTFATTSAETSREIPPTCSPGGCGNCAYNED